MEAPFEYSKYVADTGFLSREEELLQFKELIKQNRNIAIYDSPNRGVESLVRKAFSSIRTESLKYPYCVVDLFTVRTLNDFYLQIKRSLSQHFPNENFSSLPSSIRRVEELSKLFNLAEKASQAKGYYLSIFFLNFQSLSLYEDEYQLFKYLEKQFAEHQNLIYIMGGSQLNAMKYIFEEKKYFYFSTDIIRLKEIPKKIFTDYINRTFLKVGRVIESDQLSTIYDIVDGDPFYVNLLSSICFDRTRGYLTTQMLEDSISSLISIYSAKFLATMNDLTDYQLSMLRAVYNGVERFSTTTIIEEYHLNSSANVRRVKDALKKKEIITFDENERARIIDPLFKYWLSLTFFKGEKSVKY